MDLSPDAVGKVAQALHLVVDLLKLIGDLGCLIGHDLQRVQLGQRVLGVVGRVVDGHLRLGRLRGHAEKRRRQRDGAEEISFHGGLLKEKVR